MRLTRSQEKAGRLAESIGDDMNLRRQPAFRASESLLCLGGRGVLAPLLRAPAAC